MSLQCFWKPECVSAKSVSDQAAAAFTGRGEKVGLTYKHTACTICPKGYVNLYRIYGIWIQLKSLENHLITGNKRLYKMIKILFICHGSIGTQMGFA